MAQPWDDLLLLFPDNDQGLITAEAMRTQVETLELVDSENVKGQSTQVIIKNPDDALDIADTVASIIDAASGVRYVITLNAGEYTTKPVTMKPYVYIQGEPGVVINPSTISDTMFAMATSTTLDSVTLVGATSGIGVSWAGAGFCNLSNITFNSCDVGLYVNCTGGAEGHGLTGAGVGTKVIHHVKGNVRYLHPSIAGDATYSEFIHLDTAETIATVDNPLSFSPNITSALKFTGGAQVLVNNPSVVLATYGLHIEGDTRVVIKGGGFFQCGMGSYIPNVTGSPNVEMTGTSSLNSTVYDDNWENPRLTLTGMGVTDLSNSFVVEGASITGMGIDETKGDEGCQFFGEVKVGTALAPAESCFGEGDSYASLTTAAMYTWDGAVWADVTASLASPDSSTVTWPGTAIDTAVYFASIIVKDGDSVKIPGFKYICTQAALSASGDGPMVIEYFTGSAWEEVHSMTSDAGGSYQSQAERVFEEAGTFQTRLNAYLATTAWSKSDPMSSGTERYWVRVRAIEVLTQLPILEQVKVHSNRTEINEDGYMEFFGKARAFRALPWDVGLLIATGNNPIGTHLYVSDSLDRNLVGNVFRNADSDSVGFSTYLPNDVDTSTPLGVRMAVVSTSGGSTEAQFVVRWGWTHDGDSVYDSTGNAPTVGPNEQSVVVNLIMPASPDIQTSFLATIDISKMVPAREVGAGDLLWFSVERPQGDAHTGNISIINLSAEYSTYSLGGHI